jgi:hypothetical protein
LTLYVARFEEIAWGVALLAIIMVLHGLGMVWTLRAVHGLKSRLGPDLNLAKSLLVLVVAAWLITGAHLVEVVAWAGFLRWKEARCRTRAWRTTSLSSTTRRSAANTTCR